MGKRRKPTPKPKVPAGANESWAACVKALGLRALATGKFWQFCFAAVGVVIARQIQSSDWVKIAELIIGSQVYSALGWILFVLAIIIGMSVQKLQRPSLWLTN